MHIQLRVVADQLFEYAWEALAELGTCDGLGGAEYRRVKEEWAAAGYPDDLHVFIRQRANAPYRQVGHKLGTESCQTAKFP